MAERILRSLGKACVVASLLVLCACQVSLGGLGDRAPEPEPDINIGYGEESLTVEELRAAVLAFSGRLYGTIGPAFNALARSAEDAQERLYASRMRFYTLASATDIATSESPAAALLDMIVFTRVQHLSWASDGLAQWGEDARPLARAFASMEKEIWDLSARVLGPEQRRELRQLIDEWWASHPGERKASFIRLTDFGDLGQKTALREIRSAGGLLGQVQSALGQVDQLRSTAERGIHFAKTAQALLPVQLDLMVRELFAEPEMQDLFRLVASVRVLTESLAEQAEAIADLPETMRTEAGGLIDAAMAKVSAERTAAIEQAMEGVARERNIVLTQAFEQVTEERKATLDDMFERVDAVRSEVTEELRTIVREERVATLDDAFGRIAEERKIILEEMKALVAEERATVLDETRALIQGEREAALAGVAEMMDGAFGQLRGLLLLAAALAAGLLVLAAVLRARRPRGSRGDASQ